MKRGSKGSARRGLDPTVDDVDVRDYASIAVSLGGILSDTRARIEVVTSIVNSANAELSDLYNTQDGIERALRMPEVPSPSRATTGTPVSSRR